MGDQGLIPSTGRDFSLCHHSLVLELLPWEYSNWVVKLTTHPCPVPRGRMCGTISPLPICHHVVVFAYACGYVFMAWCL